MKRKKRKKSAFKIKSTNLVPIISPEEQRKKFPKELLDAFLNLDKTAILTKKYGIEFYDWAEEAHELYEIEAEKYLGDKINDRIKSGRLVVSLSKATVDLNNDKKQKRKKQTKKD